MSFKEKYIKYKNKYLLLKKKNQQKGGSHELYMAVVENNSNQVNEILQRMDIDGAERIDLNYKPPQDFRDHKDMLNTAISNNNYEIVRNLLEHGIIDINNTDRNKNTYLMNAVIQGNILIIKLVLRYQNKYDAGFTNKDGNTAIMLATSSGRADILRLLADYQTDIMAIEYEYVPEHIPVPVPVAAPRYGMIPANISRRIDSFRRNPILIAINNIRTIDEQEVRNLSAAVLQDYNSGATIMENPIIDITTRMSGKVTDKPILIIDGENLLGEFLPIITGGVGSFYRSNRFRRYTIDGIDYEINPLLLFINYCASKKIYSKLIIICKDDRTFQRLLEEYNNVANTVTLRTWRGGAAPVMRRFDISEIKRRALDLSIDIIHVSAHNSMLGAYPKELRSYDDCLLIAFFFHCQRNKINADVYSRDRRMITDFYTEKNHLLPFTVGINNNPQRLLFDQTKEIIFTTQYNQAQTQVQIDTFNRSNITLPIYPRNEGNEDKTIDLILKEYFVSLGLTIMPMDLD